MSGQLSESSHLAITRNIHYIIIFLNCRTLSSQKISLENSNLYRNRITLVKPGLCALGSCLLCFPHIYPSLTEAWENQAV